MKGNQKRIDSQSRPSHTHTHTEQTHTHTHTHTQNKQRFESTFPNSSLLIELCVSQLLKFIFLPGK